MQVEIMIVHSVNWYRGFRTAIHFLHNPTSHQPTPRTVSGALTSAAHQKSTAGEMSKVQLKSSAMEEVEGQSGRRYRLQSILQDKETAFGRVYYATYVQPKAYSLMPQTDFNQAWRNSICSQGDP